jgi:hypothetical protein
MSFGSKFPIRARGSGIKAGSRFSRIEIFKEPDALFDAVVFVFFHSCGIVILPNKVRPTDPCSTLRSALGALPNSQLLPPAIPTSSPYCNFSINSTIKIYVY